METEKNDLTEQQHEALIEAIQNGDERGFVARMLAEAWDEGFTRGFYDVLAGADRDASESAADNPYR